MSSHKPERLSRFADSVRTVRAYVFGPDEDYRDAFDPAFWYSATGRLQVGDRIECHSHTHDIQFFVLIFGADIKVAGSASILISLGVVLVGLWRFWLSGTIPTGRGVQRITTAMALGSIIGATLGGLAIAYAPVVFLKVLLGAVLLAAAGKTLTHER